MTFTLTDFIILLVVGFLAGRVIYHMFKHRNESYCDRCAYAKKCSNQIEKRMFKRTFLFFFLILFSL